MKAVLCKELGPPEKLVVEDVPEPTPAAGQVRVAMHACAINFPDVLVIQGKYQFKPALPFSPGGEFCGTVDAVGQGVRGGRPVIGCVAGPTGAGSRKKWWRMRTQCVVCPQGSIRKSRRPS